MKKTFTFQKLLYISVVQMILLTIFGFATTAFAVVSVDQASASVGTIQPVSEQPIQSEVDTNQDQQVYTSSVLTTKESYVAGDNIDYSFQLYNATPFDVNALYYKVIISDAVRGDRSASYTVRGPLSIQAGATIKVIDQVGAPKSLLGEQVVIRIVPVIHSGVTYPYAQSKPFVVKNTLPAFEMGSWVLTTNDGNLYPFQAGPSLYQNATPSSATIDIWLKPQPQVEKVKYNIQVFKRAAGIGAPVFSNFSDVLVVAPEDIKKEEEGGLDISIPLPTFSYTPGVYEAYIEFLDENNIVRAPIIVARYIVQGDVASIQFARTNKDTVTKGEKITLITSITGSPTDIFTRNQSIKSTPVHMSAEILNEKDEVVGSVTKNIVLTEDFFDETELVAQESAKAMYVHVLVTKDGKTLAEWSNPVSGDYFEIQAATHSKEMKQIFTLVGGIFFVIAVFAISMFIKRRNVTVAPVALLFILMGMYSIAVFAPINVDAAGAPPTVQITFPAEGQVLLPGQKFIPKASVYYKACANWGYNVDIQFSHNGTILDPMHSISNVAKSTAHCAGGINKGKLCTQVGGRLTSQCPTRSGNNGRCVFDTHELVGPNNDEYTARKEATAPMVAGSYIVSTSVQGTGTTYDAAGAEYNGLLTSSDENTYRVGAAVDTPSVTASASTNCTAQINLDWPDVADADSYIISRSDTGSATGFTSVATVSNSSYVDSSIFMDKTYYYKVIAKSSLKNAESAPSATASATWTRDNSCGICVAGDPTCDSSIITTEGGGGNPSCNTGQSYCSAVSACIPDADTCENPCASPSIIIGTPLATTNLCTSGFNLVNLSLFGSINTNTWYWTCQKPSISTTVQCSKACPIGTFFDQTSNSCSDTVSDWCPNIPGDQTNVTLYARNQDGTCLIDGKIKYFRFSPDTADLTCPAFWDTEVSPGAYADCKIDNLAVPAQYPVGSPATKTYSAGGFHTLACSIKVIEDDSVIKSVESLARCFRNTNVKEN